MSLRSTDALFARYCRTGDGKALGIVFDRTAPELLRIAGWLCGNRADADGWVDFDRLPGHDFTLREVTSTNRGFWPGPSVWHVTRQALGGEVSAR